MSTVKTHQLFIRTVHERDSLCIANLSSHTDDLNTPIEFLRSSKSSGKPFSKSEIPQTISGCATSQSAEPLSLAHIRGIDKLIRSKRISALQNNFTTSSFNGGQPREYQVISLAINKQEVNTMLQIASTFLVCRRNQVGTYCKFRLIIQ